MKTAKPKEAKKPLAISKEVKVISEFIYDNLHGKYMQKLTALRIEKIITDLLKKDRKQFKDACIKKQERIINEIKKNCPKTLYYDGMIRGYKENIEILNEQHEKQNG